MTIEQKTITFYDESWYDNPPCDCCQGSWMECWNSDLPINGSCSSREDCYISALEYFGYPIRDMTDEACWDWTEDELESVAREWKICVDFVEEERK